MANLMPLPKMRFTNAGRPLVGGKVFFYVAGTTTPKNTFKDRSQATANTNPVILDSNGEADIWLEVGYYKVVLKTSNDVTIWTADRIATDVGGLNVDDLIAAVNASQTAAGVAVAAVSGSVNTFFAPTKAAGDTLAASLADGATVITDADEAATPVGVQTRRTVSGGILSAIVSFLKTGAIAWKHGGTGAVWRTLYARLMDLPVTVNDFGVDPTGLSDSTVGLKAAFDYAIPLGVTLELEGRYLISGAIQPYASRASGEMHLVCKGNVVITVDPASTAFSDTLYFHTVAINSATISGGTLTIDGSGKSGRGITIRHDGARGGDVTISARLKLLNFFERNAAETRENESLLVFGDYISVTIDRPYVVGLQRTNTSGGACKGISVSAFTGDVVINQPHVENVLVPSTGSTDADGIATFGKLIGTIYNARPGKVTINQPTFIDCQGRSYKSQCSDSTLIRPKVKRQAHVTITNGADFDFQYGNGLVIEPEYEYRLNGATSPLGSSFASVVFQQLLDDTPMRSKSIGGTLKTEVLVPRYCAVTHQASSLYSETEVSGLKVIPIGSLTTKAIDRAILETRMNTIVAKSTKTKLAVRDVSGPLQCYGIGYSDYTSGSLASKLLWEVTNCYNTLTVTSGSRPFHSLSGSIVTEVESFLVRNNFGFRDLLANSWTFTFNKLVPGCVFTADISSVVATGAPGWGASGYALIEALGCWFSDTDKNIRVTKDNAAVANTVFYTQNGGATWGTIK